MYNKLKIILNRRQMLTTETLTTNEAIVAGGIAGGLLAGVLICTFIWYIITIIATWRIFKKAGEPGWKSLIPIYNYYIMFKIVGMSGWFWAELVIVIIASIIFGAQGYNPYASSAELAAYNYGSSPLVIITLLVLLVFTLVMAIVNSIRTSHAFNHGGWFAAGLFFFQPIFWLILGFGGSKYNKKAALKK